MYFSRTLFVVDAFKAGVDYNHINLDAFVPQYFDGLFQFISDQPYNPDDPLTHPVIYLHGTGDPFRLPWQMTWAAMPSLSMSRRRACMS